MPASKIPSRFDQPAGSGSFSLTTVEKDLGSTACSSGKFDITGLSGLTPNQPVFAQQAIGPYTEKGDLVDEVEMDLISIKGAYVLNSTTIRVYWDSYPSFVIGNFKFNYVIG